MSKDLKISMTARRPSNLKNVGAHYQIDSSKQGANMQEAGPEGLRLNENKMPVVEIVLGLIVCKKIVCRRR